MKRLYVGNLDFHTTEEDIRSTFETFGDVVSVHLVKDRDTGRSRGFGFVEMAKANEADQALFELNLKPVHGRILNVNDPQRKVGA